MSGLALPDMLDAARFNGRLVGMAKPHREEPGCDDGDEAPVFTLPGKSVADLLCEKLPPTSWAIDGFPLPTESSGLLVSDANVGKTLLAFDCAAQAVKAGKRVYLVEEEGSKRGLQKRLQRACAAAGLTNVDPARFRYEFQSGLYLLNRPEMRAFEKRVRGFDLIILDSLAALTRGMDENSEEMAVAVEAIKQVQIQSGGSTLTLHHINKEAARGKKPSLANVRGHTSLTARMDTVIELVPREVVDGQVQFEMHVTKQRDEERGPPQVVTVNMLGPAAIVDMEPLGTVRAGKAPKPSVDELVFAALPDAGPGKGSHELAKEVHKRQQDVGQALQRLELAGRATKGVEDKWVKCSGCSQLFPERRNGVPGVPGSREPEPGTGGGGNADAA